MTVTGQSSAATYAYDNDSRLTGITQGTTGVSFTYDAAGRRTSLTLPDGIVVNYGYDAASELTGLTYAEAGNVLGNLTYAYDGDGRRIQMGGTWARSGMPNATTSTAAYNADNELTSWNGTALSYDANGNMLSDGTNTYTWNNRNQLSSISGLVAASFVYGPFGRRRQKTIGGNTTDYLYDGANPIQESSGGTVDANMLDGLNVDEYFQRADLLGTWDYLNNALGSTVALADPTGTVQTQYTYSPFGTTTTQGQASSNPYQFTGRENDGDGLYYYRARYYDPMLSRFVSQDPAGFEGGNDLYRYTDDNPISFIDQFGLNVTITMWPGDAWGFGHVGVGVNTNSPVGFYPTSKPGCLVLGCSVPGRVRNDQRMNPGQTPQIVVIHTTHQQDVAMEKVINQWERSRETYKLWGRNCVTFVERVLSAGGLKPSHTIDPWWLFDNLP